jgi:prophage regulatory protein
MPESPVTPGQPGECLLRLPHVEARTGLKKSAIYAGMKAGTFPNCIKLGPRAAAWPSSAVDAWIAERIRIGQRGR